MLKVLIVDDEYIMRQGLRYMLKWEEEGYEIVGETSNGKEALELIEKYHPHIIISDIVMPVMDGVDFTEVIRKMYPQIPIIILSGYDNFEYVKRTLLSGVVDYILKPSLSPEVLRASLEKAVKKLPDSVAMHRKEEISHQGKVERYLFGHDTCLDQEGMRPFCEHERYRLFAIDTKKHNSKGSDLSTVLYKKLERYVREQDDMDVIFLELKDGMAGMLFCYEFYQEKKILSSVEQLCAELEMVCDQAFGVLSPVFRKMEMVKTVFRQQVLPNIGKKFYYETDNVLFLHSGAEQNQKMEKFDFVKYNFALENRKYTEAIQMLNEYNRRAIEGMMDEYKLKNQMKNMMYCLIDAMNIEEDIKEELQESVFEKIEQTHGKEQYQSVISSIITTLEKMTDMESGKGDGRLEGILSYIEEFYYEDLKLDVIADKFGFNYSYLSAFFAQQMKEGFNDYVNRIRIAKACQMLKETQMTIAEISQRVGYSEHSYFSRVFRKVTGKTPSEWRRNRV